MAENPAQDCAPNVSIISDEPNNSCHHRCKSAREELLSSQRVWHKQGQTIVWILEEDEIHPKVRLSVREELRAKRDKRKMTRINRKDRR